jgi:hypothetical protein
MMINPDWNYGYLRARGYGYGADDEETKSKGKGDSSEAAVEAGAKALESGFSFLSTWKSAGEATKQAEITARQQRQADRAGREQAVSTQNLALIALAKGEQETAAQKELVKNFMIGVAILGVLGTGIYFANKLYFSK